MIGHIEYALRRVRNALSRTAWGMRWLGLAPHGATRDQPGLVLIQIDGLSRHEMQRALADGRLPFLRRLLQRESYRDHAMYSGVSSNTPVVQGELFYGIAQAIPAFCYYDHRAQRIFSMFEGVDVRVIESRLRKRGRPLLNGGSAYSNIYGGGAAECHLCMCQLGADDVLSSPRPVKALLSLVHIFSFARILCLMLVELGLAIADAFRGIVHRQDLGRELKFVPARVAVCIFMRELIVMRSAMDVMRGLPIVQMNFLGYDEQAHRRGPGSRFAHWSLKGIDDAVRRVYEAAHRSTRRDYDVWIYSDHGQERVASYVDLHGEELRDAVVRVFEETFPPGERPETVLPCTREVLTAVPRSRPETQPPDRLPLVTALGPFGCLYTFASLSDAQRDRYAEALVRDAGIPLLIATDADHTGQIRAWTPDGAFTLPQDADAVLGATHPARGAVTRDLLALARHADAGDFLVCGYRSRGRCVSFARENGAHGGVSPRETGAFALLPDDAPLPDPDAPLMRIADLREAVFRLLDRDTPVAVPPQAPSERAVLTLKVLTYNVHSCLGTDGMLSPHRVARVMQREQPDIICLQEVDMHRARTGAIDQAHTLARYLAMHHEFHPAMRIEGGHYGDAILSRFPMTLEKAAGLPYRKGFVVDEPRGALWAKVDIGGGRHVHVFNTHLGLWPQERLAQAEALLGEDWLGHPACTGPVILCGDFNSSPGSLVCRRVAGKLRMAQNHLAGHRPQSTFSGRWPVKRLDYIFINEAFDVLGVHVANTLLARAASDHLPLCVTLRLH